MFQTPHKFMTRVILQGPGVKESATFLDCVMNVLKNGAESALLDFFFISYSKILAYN